MLVLWPSRRQFVLGLDQTEMCTYPWRICYQWSTPMILFLMVSDCESGLCTKQEEWFEGDRKSFGGNSLLIWKVIHVHSRMLQFGHVTIILQNYLKIINSLLHWEGKTGISFFQKNFRKLALLMTLCLVHFLCTVWGFTYIFPNWSWYEICIKAIHVNNLHVLTSDLWWIARLSFQIALYLLVK